MSARRIPRHNSRRYASHRYSYGHNGYRSFDPHYRNYGFGFGLGLGLGHDYGYGLGHGYGYGHSLNDWGYGGYHPLNYSSWWFPSSYAYSPTTYVYVNDQGAYSPYPSTVAVNNAETAPERISTVDVKAGTDAKAKVEKPDTETVVARHVTLGDFYFKEGRYRESADSYLRAIAAAPEDASLHFVLADSLFALGDFHYAAFSIKKAVQLDPEIAYAEADKRKFYADKADFEQHMAALLEYTDSKPYDDNALLVLGYNQKFSNQPERAAKTFRRVLKISPDHVAGKLFLAAVTSPKTKAETETEKSDTSDSSTPGTKTLRPGTASPRRRPGSRSTRK